MFRLFECCALSFFERFVLSFSLKIERFVSDSAEIWICGLYIDENIASLQKNFDQFKVNTPLISVSPLKAYIGLKEGVTEKSKFEVLEAELSKEGKMTYKRVGVIQPKENLIWDNRYMASEEQAYGSDFGFTTFRKVSGGDFYPGMLIREIK